MGLFKSKHEKLQSRLSKARRNQSVEKMRSALEEGADANDRTGGHGEIYRAVYHRFTDGVRLLLEFGADPNDATEGGHTGLMEAARDGSFDIARLLIEKGADVNARRNDGWTALHFAAQAGRGDVIKLLIEKGADRAAVDNRMNTPADLADKEFPRLADLIRGVNRQEADAGKEVRAGWHLTAADEVAAVNDLAAIGYRLTEVFNFGTGIYTRIAHNLKTGAESQSVRFFDEFGSRAAIDRAREELVRLGGTAADEAVTISKPALHKQGPQP